VSVPRTRGTHFVSFHSLAYILTNYIYFLFCFLRDLHFTPSHLGRTSIFGPLGARGDNTRTVQNLGRPGLGPHWVEHQDILSPVSVIRASFGRMTTDKSIHAFERDHVGQIHLETTFAPTLEMSSSEYTCRYADGERELLPIPVFPLELSDTIALQLIPTLFRSHPISTANASESSLIP
jgi:hypothetical protein